MKGKILLVLGLLTVSAGCVFGAAACKTKNNDAVTEDHVHSYSENWFSDGTEHWHVCEICGERVEVEQHAVSVKWSYDETQHWHECEICGAQSDAEIHAFEDSICTVCNYKHEAPDIQLNKASVSLFTDEQTQLVATVTPLGITEKIIWTSTDPSVATVSDSGYVTAVGDGTAKIIAGLVGGNTAECIVVVHNISGLVFKEYGTGYAVTGYDDMQTSVTVPASYNGKPVVAIGTGLNDGFTGCVNLLSVVLPDSVTEINDGGFSGCLHLANVTLPSSLRTIGSYAFENCVELKKIILPEGLQSFGSYAFYNCRSLTSVIIPKGIKSIAYETFWNCTSLSSVYLPEGLTEICANAFSGCSSLKYIALPDSLQIIGDFAFRDCIGLLSIIIGDNVVTVGKYAFNNCTAVKSVTMGNGVTTVGDYAFQNCISLRSIVMSDELKVLGSYVFNNCTALISITIPENVTQIGKYAFAGCSWLAEVNYNAINCEDFSENNYVFASAVAGITLNIGNNVTKIPANLFYACSLGDTTAPVVSAVKFAANAKCNSIGANAFRNCTGIKVYINDLAEWCKVTFENMYSNPLHSAGTLFQNEIPVTGITIPDTVTAIGNYTFCGSRYLQSVATNKVVSIGEYAFNDCPSLENIVFGDVRHIANYAFAKCVSIENVSLPVSLVEVGGYAFVNCTKLKSVDVSDGVTKIGDSAFENCTNLADLTLGYNLTSIGERAFYNCTALTQLNYNAADCIDLDADNYVFAFAGCQTGGITVTVGSNVTAVPDNLFYTYSYVNSYAPNITTLVFDENSRCQSIGTNTFRGCTDIDFAVIPSYLLSYVTDLNLITLVISEGDSIEFGALKCFDKLESLMIPYVGANRYGTAESYFGYIFGAKDGYSQSVYIPETLKDVIISGRTEISDYAFRDCDTIQSIILGDRVTSIGASAFWRCTALETVRIGDGVNSLGENAFSDCTGLKNVFIGNSVQSIGNRAFENCTSLENVVFGECVESICSQAFYGCVGLKRLVLPDGLVSIEASAFNGCSNLVYLSIPDSITYIAYGAFEGCDNLAYGTYGSAYYLGNEDNPYVVLMKAYNTDITNCVIYANTKIIYSGAFAGCRYLTEIYVPDNVKCIGDSAFSGCYNLDGVNLPYGLTYIGPSAFYGCSSLENISVPSSVNYIGNYAFSGCNNLNYEEYENGFYIGNSSNPYVVLVKAVNTEITGCVIHSSTLIICSYAFRDCDSLTDVVIPANVKYIGDYAFVNCYGLTSVVMGKGITRIEDYAFSNCINLNTVYYTGNSTQWSAIDIRPNEYLTNSKIYYFSYYEPIGEDGTTISDTFWHYDNDGVTPVIW